MQVLPRPQLSQAIASQIAAVAEHRLLLPGGCFLWDPADYHVVSLCVTLLAAIPVPTRPCRN